MIIGIQKGLDGIKASLQNKGYDVKEVHGVYSAPVDVYIYDGHEGEFCLMEGATIPSMAGMINSIEQRDYRGTFLVNASRRSVEEIEAMICRRTYTPLF